MKQFMNRFLSLLALVSTAATVNAACDTNKCDVVSPTFFNRSQVPTTMYKLIGMEGHTHLYDMECFWGTANLALEYTRSFRPERLAGCLFGKDLVAGVDCNSSCNTSCNTSSSCATDCDRGNTILIQGNCVENRDSRAWLADYFYLPTDYNGSITFNPHISNVNVPLDLYFGLDEWMCNLYFRTYGSITHTRWQLDPCQSITAAGTNDYDAGYFGQDPIANSRLLHSALDFFAGNNISATGDDANLVFESLRFARISNCVQTRTGFADLTFELGWDFINDCDYHFGLGFLFKAPTGNRREACYAFSPVVGNGKHWEVGGVITGHYTFWRSCDEDKYFGFHFDTNITHIVSAREQLTFDLKCKPNSRYMLAQRMTKTPVNNISGITEMPATDPITEATAANKQFDGHYAPVANLTTFNTDVKYGVQGDISAKFNYTACNWSFDLGYNFWGRSCNDISLDNCECDNNRLSNECWVLKGNQRNYGYAVELGTDDSLDANTPVALSASQSKATIHGGTNPETGGTDCLTNNNTNIDNPRFAVARADDTADFQPLSRSNTPGTDIVDIIRTSIQPISLTINDVDFVEQRGISHRIFGHINYTWDCECWIPYLGFGAYAEFGKTEGKDCNLDCGTNACTPSTSVSNSCNTYNNCDNNCVDCALSQWAVWLKFGVSWN